MGYIHELSQWNLPLNSVLKFVLKVSTALNNYEASDYSKISKLFKLIAFEVKTRHKNKLQLQIN